MVQVTTDVTSITATSARGTHVVRSCGMNRNKQRRIEMTPDMNDVANCELSIEELEAIAAGWSLGGILHSIGEAVKDGYNFVTHLSDNQKLLGIGGGAVIDRIIRAL